MVCTHQHNTLRNQTKEDLHYASPLERGVINIIIGSSQLGCTYMTMAKVVGTSISFCQVGGWGVTITLYKKKVHTVKNWQKISSKDSVSNHMNRCMWTVNWKTWNLNLEINLRKKKILVNEFT